MKTQYLFVNNNSTGVAVLLARTTLQRLRGWMWTQTPPDTGLLIFPCNGIHTFFVKFPIDAVFLDSRHTVVKIARNLNPWRMIPIVPLANSVLELPAGWADKLSINAGDNLSFASEQAVNAGQIPGLYGNAASNNTVSLS